MTREKLTRAAGLLLAATLLLLPSCAKRGGDEAGQTPLENRQGETAVISSETQKIDLDGVQNARQLGGYLCADGRRVKDGVLLRSGALNALTEAGAQTLAEQYHLKYIFDFRMPFEREAQPDAEVAGAENLSLSVFSSAIYGEKVLKELQEAMAAGNQGQTMVILAKNQGLTTIYQNMLLTPEGQQAYAAFFRTLVDDVGEGEAVLWHCTQGKDRAGMASALLLYALGADEATVKADYLLTNDFYPDLIQQSKAQAEALGLTEAETREFVALAASVDEGFFDAAMDSVKENYGSVQDYLQTQLGLTDADLQTLRDKFLE